MGDLDILRELLARIGSFSLGGPESLGEISRDLEILFEQLNTRLPSVERAYYNFCNAAEVIWVSSTELGRPMTGLDHKEATILLSKLDGVLTAEIVLLEN